MRAVATSAVLSAVHPGCATPSQLSSPAVRQGFENVGGGKESGTDTPLRLVHRITNTGARAESATFVLQLGEEDGRTVWTGRAAATEVEPGEPFSVTYVSREPMPDGDQYVLWRVEDVVR